MWIAQHISQPIARPPAQVVAFAQDLSAWAAGVRDDMTVTFLPGRDLGILDHDVTLPDGRTFHNPLRVLANDDGSEVVFTLYRREGVTDEDFAADAAAIAADLAHLRELLE
ncbi:MAG: hypothetical protein JWP32_1925 [Schumannella sp.]|nr:hypothetical protein [Schumannella sp.]